MGVYRRLDSPVWWMSLQAGGSRVRMATGTTDRRLANDVFAAWQTESARVRWLGPPPPERDHTVQELLTEYLAKVTPGKALDSQRRDRGVLRRFGEEWGPLLLADISSKLLVDNIADRQEDVCFATVSKEMGILKSAFSHAIRWGWATTSPFVGIPLDQSGDERIRWLSEEEEDRLVAACPDWARDLVVIALDTGLRRGNVVGLQRQWVQPGGHTLVIPRKSVKGKKVQLCLPLTERAAAIIRRHLAGPDATHVFVGPDGRPYRRDQLTMAVSRAADAAGLVEVCLHTLRHTFISRLVQAGRDLREVMELAGHRDIRMTMRYAHLRPNQLIDAIRSIERPRASSQ